MEQNECRWQEELTEDADYVLVAYGTTARIARTAMRKLRGQGHQGRADPAHHPVALPQ